MIKATGNKNGRRLTVEYNEGRFAFNGKEDYRLEAELMIMLEERYPIGGTYYAENAMDDLNIINVLSNRFFDRTVDVESDTREELPREEGDIY